MKRSRRRCSRKRAFPSIERAEDAIIGLRNLGISKESETVKLHSYFCQRCQSWHVGHHELKEEPS